VVFLDHTLATPRNGFLMAARPIQLV
jgi:hypothetical protein